MTTLDTTLKQSNESDLIEHYFTEDPVKPEFEPINEIPRYRPAKAKIDPDQSKGWFRRLFPIIYSHKVLMIGSLVTLFAGMLLNVSVPAIIGKTLDHGLIDKTRPIMPYVLLLVGIGISHGLFIYCSRYLLSRITYQLEYDLRTIIYDHLTKLSFSFFDKIQSGQVISRANSDIRAIEMFFRFAPNLATMMISFTLSLSYMLYMHVKLTIVALLALPVVFKLSAQMRKIMFPLSWLNQARVAEVTTIVDENVNGVRVVKSFAAELQQIKLLAKAAESLRWANIQTVKLRARFMPLIGNVPRISLALVVFYGGYLAIEGEITIGDLVAFNSYMMMVAMPFRMFAMFLMQYERSRASAKRIYEILDEKSDIVESPDAVDLKDPKGEVEFRDVTFSYANGPDILNEFNLKISPAESIAIVGRTSSGKSTVTRLITRFYDVKQGGVYIDGKDIRDVTIVSLRACIGVVLDEPFLFSMSIKDNIAYGRPDAGMDDVIHAAKLASAHEFICELPEGYDSVVGERGYTLSGGQRQRIAIARTLLVNPRILVLDDATSSVDVQVEAEIHKALKVLMENRTTIIIAHRLSTIMLADRVVLLDKGRIAASGTHTELMANEPRYVEVLARASEESNLVQKDDGSGESKSNPAFDSTATRPLDTLLPPDIDSYGGSN